MNHDDTEFPYSKSDFDEDDNIKLAKMIKWSYGHLHSCYEKNKKAIKKNDKRLESLESGDIKELENRIKGLERKNKDVRKFKMYLLKILGVVGVISTVLVMIIGLTI